uniref:Uncharacterized protein n=1 Tax=Arundo donax TaxID=35708 RepID=A0A0A9HS64_ARUDO
MACCILGHCASLLVSGSSSLLPYPAAIEAEPVETSSWFALAVSSATSGFSIGGMLVKISSKSFLIFRLMFGFIFIFDLKSSSLLFLKSGFPQGATFFCLLPVPAVKLSLPGQLSCISLALILVCSQLAATRSMKDYLPLICLLLIAVTSTEDHFASVCSVSCFQLFPSQASKDSNKLRL